MLTVIPLWRRLICRIVGHRPVRLITGLALEGASAFGAAFRVTDSRQECGRCGDRLQGRSGLWPA